MAKRKVMMKQGEPLYIEWIDSASQRATEESWCDMDHALEGIQETVMKSVGFFVGKTKGFIVIAGNMDMINDPPMCCDVFQIPEVNVKKIKRIKL